MPGVQFPEESIGEFGRQAAAWGPRVLLALAVLAAGWLLARILRAITGKLFGSWASWVTIRVSRLVRSNDDQAKLQRTTTSASVSRAAQAIVFWVVLLIFAAIAAETLDLNVVAIWLNELVGFLPRIAGALFVILTGVLIGSPVRSAVSAAAARAGFSYPQALGQMMRIGILLVAVIVAFDQIGIQVAFLIVMVAVISGGLLGGAALAFGLGARASVSNILSSYYLNRVFQVGHQIRIGEIEGKILEITPTSVIVDAGGGRTVIPASMFSDQVAVLLSK